MMRFSVFRESQRNFVWHFTKSRAWSNTTCKTTEQHAEQLLVEKCKLTQSLISTGRLELPCVTLNSRNQCKNYLPTSYTVQKHSTSIILDQTKTLVNVCGTQSARQLCTITTFDSKDGTIDNHDNNSSSDSSIDEDVLTQDQDWVHPSTRQESILDKDPGLRSILGELASDFGKSDTCDQKNSETKSVNVCDDEVDGTADTYGVNLDYHDDITRIEQHSETRNQNDKKELTSDQSSVFSISDVVEILHEENAKDICVIKVPKNRGYVDYFAVVTGRSNRHLRAMVSNLNKRYKEAKHSKDPFMKIEGKMADDWMCIDFGDIVVHFMMEETRELYELEMLWTLGPEYDTQYHRISEYQANVIQPVQLTVDELLEYESGFEGSQETEGYSVIIEQDEESVDDIPSDKRI